MEISCQSGEKPKIHFYLASNLLLQDVGYVKEVKATEHPGRLDHPKGKTIVGSPAVASAEESQSESALLLMSLTYESVEADILLMPLHSGGKQVPSGAAVATHKAKWQGEIRVYTAHLHLTDGEMDMSEDLGYASPLSSLRVGSRSAYHLDCCISAHLISHWAHQF